MTVIQRQSWVWAVLPEQAASVDSHGDPALAEVLRDSGYSVEQKAANGGVDVVLFDTEDVPGADDLKSAVAELKEGGVISIAVAGGRVGRRARCPWWCACSSC